MILTLLLLATPPFPATAKHPVIDEYFGTRLTDDYRWLENGADADVKKWSDAQNARSRAVLDALRGRAELQKRVEAVLGHPTPRWAGLVARGATLFALKFQPPRQQPSVVAIDSYQSELKERVLVDPIAIDPTGSTAIDFFEPSLDGKKVVVSLSKGGSERGDGHVFDVATGKEEGEPVPAINTGTAGGSAAWSSDGFFYTRHPLEGERPAADLNFFQQVWFHKLGTSPKTDTHSLGKDFERIAENFLQSSDDGKWVLDLKQKGDGGEFELWLRPAGGKWFQVSKYEDKVIDAELGLDGAAYLRSTDKAPRGKLLRLPLATPSLDKATVVVPEGKGVLAGFRATRTKLYLREQLGAASTVRVVSLTGEPLMRMPTAPLTTVKRLVRSGPDEVLVSVSGYLQPTGFFRYDSATAGLLPTRLMETSPVDLSGFEAIEDSCTSKDGTQIPISILRAKGTRLDGKRPTILSGYGGFNITLSPQFDSFEALWLELGGVWAEANLRGGGEFGERWHQGGMLTQKQNVFDDMYACVKRLTELKITQGERLAIEGASNGGLLMGAMLTQHPEAAKAVVAEVGYYDMLRFETAPNGVFNTTEYGSVKDETQFKALAAYSPYQHVKDGVQYPAVLMLTGANDPRVDPFHSRKFTARLQASGTQRPILLRTSADTGHGMGTPLQEQIAQTVDTLAFVCDQLGVKVSSK
jgi:prolyl oligopeptidase